MRKQTTNFTYGACNCNSLSGRFSIIRRAQNLVVQIALLLMALCAPAVAVERFPPPDFTSGYKIPTTSTPLPRGEWFSYLDTGLLFVALLLAFYFAIVRRSRRGIAGLSIFSLLYFGFYRHGCICSIGAIQNVALSVANTGYALPMAAAVFFLLPLIFALFAGRVFCAAVCPLGALQEIVLRRPVKVPQALAHALGLIPWVYLGAAVLYAATGSAFLICRYDPFVLFFRFSGSLGMLIFGVLMLSIAVFVGRPYCRFMCPYGALLRLISPLSKYKVTVSPDECVQCRLCEDACPYGQIKYPNVQANKVGRYEGKKRLAALVLLLPVMIALGSYLGHASSGMLSRVDPTIRLARRVWLEEKGQVRGTTDETDAWRKTDLPNAVVYARALDVSRRFSKGSAIFGGWIGLIIGGKLISLSIRRRRSDYEADTAGCVACGRCYMYCPVECARHGDAEAKKIIEEAENASSRK